MRTLRRVVTIVALFVVLAVTAGAIYQAAASARDAARFPMPGKRIDIGGRSLHLYCSGAGTPTVLLENGLSVNYTTWQVVQPAIAELTRVCSYDRAGMGWSDPSPNPTQSRFVNADLHALLAAAKIDGPIVLVGHSAGGVFVRGYFHDYRSDVVGMVLIDSSHEQQRNRFPHDPQADAVERRTLDQIRLCKAVAWTGLLRATGTLDALGAKLPDAIRPASVALSNRTGFCGGVEHEMVTFEPDVSQSSAPASLGDLPLVVLTHGRAPAPQDFPLPMPENYLKEAERVWRELQDELARLSTRASHRIVANSGHFIQLEAPDAVVQAIRDVIDGRTSDQ